MMLSCSSRVLRCVLLVSALLCAAVCASVPPYDSTKVYDTPHTQVSYSQPVTGGYYAGIFSNNWYIAAGNAPHFYPADDGWVLVGDVVFVKNLSDSTGMTVPALEWNSNGTYTGGIVVTYMGACYKARWWTRDVPTSSTWEPFVTCPVGTLAPNPLLADPSTATTPAPTTPAPTTPAPTTPAPTTPAPTTPAPTTPAPTTPAPTTPAPAPAPAPVTTPEAAITPSGAAPGVSIVVTFSLASAPWDGGFSGMMKVQNVSGVEFPAGSSGWSVQIQFPDANTAHNAIQSGPWNFAAAFDATGLVTFTPSAVGAAVPPSGSVSSAFGGGSVASLQQAVASDPSKVTIVFDLTVPAPAPSTAPAPTPTPTTSPSPSPSPSGTNTGSAGYVGPPLVIPMMPGSVTFPLSVKGWGNKLEMGTVMIPEPSKDQPLADSGLLSIFKYAGDGGDGDPGAIYFGQKWGNIFLPTATKNSMEMAKRVVKLSISSGPLSQVRKAIIPVMVVYTAQLSGGPTAVEQDILDIPAGVSSGDTEFLRDHYANLIVETTLMLSYKTDVNPYPGSIVMNPDMLGAFQQSNVMDSVFRKPDGTWVTVHVREKLSAAIDYVYSIQATAATLGFQLTLPATRPILPDDLTDDIRGWFQSQNWVIKTFGAGAITFGWQINLWAQGTSTWVHGVNGDKRKPNTDETIWQAASGPVCAFLDYTRVFQGNYAPDYVVFDRYEFDDFREAARNINYAYDSEDWFNFLTYVRQISSYLRLPAMLWQIPASHMLVQGEPVPSDTYIALHSGAGGSFYMGDVGLSVGAVNAADSMKQITLNGQPYYAGATSVGQWLNLNPAYDWTKDRIQETINSNVFSILWGGGNTMAVIETAATGYDGGWMMGKVQKYYVNGGGKDLVRK